MDLINNYRESKGLNVLKISTNLNNSAEYQNNYMIEANKITHKGLNKSSVQDRALLFHATGYNFGEIIGYSPSIEELFQGWKDSESHNKVLLDSRWTWIGISIIKQNNIYVGVINFSSGILGSVTIKKDQEIKIEGEYIERPVFDNKFIERLYINEDLNRFEIYVKTAFNNTFIYCYDKKNKITDRIDIFF
ncbi:MAG: CAP domain-containing protein [Spirochaetales bacterium]|nr:CAP domain-containing protein [Spirochaetales bacterium]